MLFHIADINTPEHQAALTRLNLTLNDTHGILQLASTILQQSRLPLPAQPIPLLNRIINTYDDIGILYQAPLPTNAQTAHNLTERFIDAFIAYQDNCGPSEGPPPFGGLCFSFLGDPNLTPA